MTLSMRISLLIGACLWLGGAGLAAAQERAEDEVLVKAAFVYNFAKFTRWPDSALGEHGAPLTLCIAGEDELAEALGRLKGRPVKGRPLAIQPYRSVRAVRDCQLIYVAASEQARQAEIVRAVRGLPVLTVSELPQFARAGGVIELYREPGRTRFAIHLGVARAAGLEISPNLLALATVIGQD